MSKLFVMLCLKFFFSRFTDRKPCDRITVKFNRYQGDIGIVIFI